jgi:hypothetical protein
MDAQPEPEPALATNVVSRPLRFPALVAHFQQECADDGVGVGGFFWPF